MILGLVIVFSCIGAIIRKPPILNSTNTITREARVHSPSSDVFSTTFGGGVDSH